MAKVLAFDYGTRRTGIAITDDLQLIASPLDAVDTSDLWKTIDQIFHSEPIDAFVVGDPAFLGEQTDSSAAIDAFCKKLHKRYPKVPLHRVDESYSSRDAMQAMITGGMKKKKRRDKKMLDKVSAAVILQRWLASDK